MRHQYHTGATVITLVGEIDLASAPELHAYIGEVRQTDADQLVFDMAAVTFLDSSGLRVLLDAHTFALQHGGAIHLTALQGPPARVIEVTDAGRHIRLHTSTDIALAAVFAAPELPAPIADASGMRPHTPG
jgi:anti-anti-sigma factor